MAEYPIRKLELDYDVNDIRERYLRLFPALISDILEDKMNLHGQVMESGMYPIDPAMKIAGPAFPMMGCSTPSRDPNRHEIRFASLKSMVEGCIQVRNSQGNTNCGQFGEMNATAAWAAGCRGTVVDGSTRDSAQLIKMGFPTFCRFRSPVEAFGRYMIVDYMIPITVRGNDGQLTVSPGDFILGDTDGVVVVPKASTVEVLEMAEDWMERERKTKEEMAAGNDPAEVFKKYGRF